MACPCNLERRLSVVAKGETKLFLPLCSEMGSQLPCLLPLQPRICRAGLRAESGTCNPGAEWEAFPQTQTVREFKQNVFQEDP